MRRLRISRRTVLAVAAGGLLFLAGRLSVRPPHATPPATPPDDLSASLDTLEAKLLVSRASVENQLELERRSQHVTQIACTNAVWHAEDMRRVAASHRRRRAKASDCDTCVIPEAERHSASTVPPAIR